MAKQIWCQSLAGCRIEDLEKAALATVKRSEYLPTVHDLVREMCRQRFPALRAAFEEACCALPPRRRHRWSHPVVYHAGQRTGWQLLRSGQERFSYTIFREGGLRRSALWQGPQNHRPSRISASKGKGSNADDQRGTAPTTRKTAIPARPDRSLAMADGVSLRPHQTPPQSLHTLPGTRLLSMGNMNKLGLQAIAITIAITWHGHGP